MHKHIISKLLDTIKTSALAIRIRQARLARFYAFRSELSKILSRFQFEHHRNCGWIIVRRTHIKMRKITLSRWMEKKKKGWFTLQPEDKKKVVVSIMLRRMLKRKGRMFKFVRTRSSPVYFLKSVGPKYKFVAYSSKNWNVVIFLNLTQIGDEAYARTLFCYATNLHRFKKLIGYLKKGPISRCIFHLMRPPRYASCLQFDLCLQLERGSCLQLEIHDVSNSRFMSPPQGSCIKLEIYVSSSSEVHVSSSRFMTSPIQGSCLFLEVYV